MSFDFHFIKKSFLKYLKPVKSVENRLEIG